MFIPRHSLRFPILLVLVAGSMPVTQRVADGQSNSTTIPPLAMVNGHPILPADLDFLCLVRQIPAADLPMLRERLIDELIDQRLIAEFLNSRKTKAPEEEVAARIATLRQLIERSGRTPEDVFAKLGLSDEAIRRTLALPLAWKQHVLRVVTGDQIQQRFEQQRPRYDGSRLRISQIVRLLPEEATEQDRDRAVALLQTVRESIVAGDIPFATAAREHSQSPSAQAGGDLGWVLYGTRIPRELADPAFQLKPGEISQPLVTRFGVHLLTVTDAQPGDLSLEDVRGEILRDLGEELWNEQLHQERQSATIERAP